MTHDAFICHSSKDRTVANAIVSKLEQHRIRCWIAPRDVVPGMDYAGAILGAITGSKLTVLVFSGNSNASPHVRREIERTVSHGIPVLPFRVEDVVPSPSLEYFISDAHWLDAMTPPLEQHLDHLVGTVRLLLERQVAAGTTAPAGITPTVVPVSITNPPPSLPPAAAVGAGGSVPRGRPAWHWAALGLGGVAAVVLAGLILLKGPSGPVAIATTPPPSELATSTPAPTPGVTHATPAPTPVASVDPTDNPADDFYDPFDFDVADAWVWWAEDPELWTVDDPFGWLTLTSPAKPPIANLLLYEPRAEGFGTTTLLRFHPTSDYQFAGLVLTGEDPNADRLQFGWAYCEGKGCLGEGLYFDRIVAGEVKGTSHATALEGSPTELYLALDVIGNGEVDETRVVYAQYSYDGGDDWFDGGVFPFDDRYTRVGVILLDATEEIAASFEYVYVARWME